MGCDWSLQFGAFEKTTWPFSDYKTETNEYTLTLSSLATLTMVTNLPALQQVSEKRLVNEQRVSSLTFI
jgi:hypothetical protein